MSEREDLVDLLSRITPVDGVSPVTGMLRSDWRDINERAIEIALPDSAPVYASEAATHAFFQKAVRARKQLIEAGV